MTRKTKLLILLAVVLALVVILACGWGAGCYSTLQAGCLEYILRGTPLP